MFYYRDQPERTRQAATTHSLQIPAQTALLWGWGKPLLYTVKHKLCFITHLSLIIHVYSSLPMLEDLSFDTV